MASTKLRPATLRLHGEDGKVFITDRNGVKLWEVCMLSIDVAENIEDVPHISIVAKGSRPE